MQNNIAAMLIDMPIIASPPQELVNLVNDLIDEGEPRMVNNIDQGVQPLVLQEALLEEQARQVQIAEDAALADLLQDDSEEDSGFESDVIEEAEEVQQEEIQQEEVMEVKSDAETVNNNASDQPEDSDSSYNESDSDLDISEVTLRRAMRVRDRFLRDVQHLLRLQRGEERRRMRRRLQSIHRRIRRREDRPYDVPRRYRDICYGCAKRFWCQRNRRSVRCTLCGFWLCPDCNVDPVHCQNERQFLP